jgi:hypothetical protein
MKLHQPLNLSVLLYEVLRVIALLIIGSSVHTESLLSPVFIAFLLAPQVLFVFMALFIWMDEQKYHMYLPLYIAGKVITLWAGLLWVVVSFLTILKSLVMYTGNPTETLMLAFTVLIPFEIVTIIGMSLKLKKSAEDK